MRGSGRVRGDIVHKIARLKHATSFGRRILYGIRQKLK